MKLIPSLLICFLCWAGLSAQELIPFDKNDFTVRVDGAAYDYQKPEAFTTPDMDAITWLYPDGRRETVGFNEDGTVYRLTESPDGRSVRQDATLDFRDGERYPQCEGSLMPPTLEDVVPTGNAPQSGCLKVHMDVGPSIPASFSWDVDSALNYVAMTWDIVSLIYAREGVPLAIVSADIYTDESVYPIELFDSYSGLSIVSEMNADYGLPGDAQLRHGLGIHAGVGGVAYIGGFNPGQSVYYKAAFSALRKENIVNGLNDYFWTIMVQAHEMGHSVGLQHTHECYHDVNGDGIYEEAIDGCVLLQGGGCAPGPVPEDGGTIMSYCHLNAVGTNIGKGFHPLNSVRMVQNALLWGSVCDVDCLGATGMAASSTSTTGTVSWTGSSEDWVITLSDGQSANVTGYTYTFSGLEPQTVYTAYLAPGCNPQFTKSVQFFTDCDVTIPAIPTDDHLDDNSFIELGTANWVWTSGQYKTGGDGPYPDGAKGYLISQCFDFRGYEYATVELDLALDLEQSTNGQGDFFSWDWVRLVYSFDGINWQPIGSYPKFYNSDRGYNGSTSQAPLDVFGGTAPMTTYSQEISFLSGEPLVMFALEFRSDDNTPQDGVTFSRFELRGVEECPEPGEVDTVYITETDTVTITDTVYVSDNADLDSLLAIIAGLGDEIDNILATVDSLTVIAENCDSSVTGEPCELIVGLPCVTLFTVGGECIDVAPIVTSNVTPSYLWSDGTTSATNTVCIGDELYVIVTAGECVDTAYLDYNVVDNKCGNPRTGGLKAEMCLNGQTICIPVSQLQEYSDQGAKLGACGDNPCDAGQRYQNGTGGVRIVPNPTDGVIRIIGGESYEIYSLDGRLLLEGANSGTVDISLFPSGVYNVVVHDKGIPVSHSIVLY